MNIRTPHYFLLLICFIVSSCFRNGANTDGLPVGKRIQLQNVEELYQFLTYDDNRYPLVSLHRGAPHPDTRRMQSKLFPITRAYSQSLLNVMFVSVKTQH
ncbi:Uncharacterised protein [Sphingobacterium multivorum]|uniref:Uncharacterized protein n=1 Tax=Sphingobacterium multivorum TaxID=28454 RepID=A0A2X2IPN2_SPHMU|nr:hypothetical protein [Sphingobacterium multivorum]SPZ83948.1 Uncharacterised protein [Sphingobacterium multivorum]